MTVEELEIIITANIENALKEFKKLVPEIRRQIKQVQGAVSNIDTKQMQSKVNQAVQFVKKKMQDLKKSNANNEIAIKVNNKEAQKQITQIQKQIDSLQEKINARQLKLDVITPQIDTILNKTRQDVAPEGISPNDKSLDNVVNNKLSSNKDFTKLNSQAQKLYTEIEQYNQLLSQAKSKMSQLGQETLKTATTQNKLSGFLNGFKEKLNQAKPITEGIGNAFKSLPKITQRITNNIKGMGAGLKKGLSHILRYAMALFSLRGIYSVLSNSASSWLSSQNAGAKQLSANIDYMKYAMGSALAPVIQFVINLVYQLMKAIQGVAYALTGVNIFANASANSYASMASSAKKANKETKQLAGVHDEINNIQNNDNSDSESGGTGTPNIDLSSIDSQMTPLAQKFYDFFKPLKESWDIYGSGLIEQVKTTAGQVGALISSVWGSFENIITNGTVYFILENILSIIENIAEAFSNAWNYNGNGDAIVQNLANAFNNLLGAINNVIQNPAFQEWLNWCSDKFREMSEKIGSIDWQPLINALMQIGTTIGTVALEILSGLVGIFKWLVENPIVAEIILAIAIAITVVSTVMGVLTTVMGVLTTVSTALNIAMLPLIGIILAIIGVITAIVLAIMNWDTIMKALTNTWNWICEQAQIIFNAIAEFFKNLWQGICDVVINIWNGITGFLGNIWNGILSTVQSVFNNIKDTISNIWNNIVNTVSNVWNTIVTKVKEGVSGAWNAITSVFGNIGNWFKEKFSSAWQAVKNVFSTGGKIFDGIKDGILSGLKSIVNAIIGGINKVISIPFNGINTALRTIRSVNIMGLRPFSWINTIGVPQIPRLAKGGVLTEPTVALAGEYAGAKSNPEIVTPQNIMEETFDRVMAKYEGEEKEISLSLTVNVGNEKLGRILLDDLRNMKRRTGKDIEALVGG